jgi:NAD(P)-dependent dehydrogenase (short-subunit alcohol dehydrogenase family)
MSRNVCITGANRGIGLGLTRYYLEQGCKVWAVARQPQALEDLKATADGRLILVKADVTHEDDHKAIAAAVGSAALDLLINNAGVLVDGRVSFSDLTPALLRQSFEVNVFGAIGVTQALLPALKRSAKPVLAMMSSQMGSIADNSSGGYYAYRSSKAALNMVTRSLARDFPWLTAVTLHPGWVQTEMGGPQAPTAVADSVKGLTQVLASVSSADSGRFVNFRGQDLPW